MPSSRGTRLLAAAAAVVVGILIGAGLFVLDYAEGASYLRDDPAACANCHIMRDQYAGWATGPHHDAATCNDCHVPHAFVRHWIGKAINGWHHSKAFTLQDFDEPIRIKARNAAALQENCRTCHDAMISEVSGHYGSEDEGPQCTHCHRGVGHGNTR